MNAPNLLRPLAAPLPADPGEAIVNILAALGGHPSGLPVDDLRALIAQNNALLDAPTPTIERVLARQAVLLEGVELAFLAKAAQSRNPDHSSIYARTALASHRALMATLGAVRQIDEDRRDAQALDA